MRVVMALSVLALTGILPAHAQSSADSTWAAYEKGFRNKCLERGRIAAANRVKDEWIVEYCDCALKRSREVFFTLDLFRALLADRPPPAMQAKIDEVGKACAQQAFGRKDQPPSKP